MRLFETALVFAVLCDAPFIELDIIRTLFTLTGDNCIIPVCEAEVESSSRSNVIWQESAATTSLEKRAASMRDILTRLNILEASLEHEA